MPDNKKNLTSLNKGYMDSLETVLLQEVSKFNRLLNRITKSLKELQQAIQGLVVMSRELDTMHSSLSSNKVPDAWTAIAFASRKPLASWFLDLLGRVEFLKTWLSEGPPAAYPLPVFFFPQGFLTGVLQNHARKYRIPINTLDFNFDVLPQFSAEHTEAPIDGVYVYGMHLQGGFWNAEQKDLVDARPGEMFSPLPLVHFLPSQGVRQSQSDHYCCPVYKTTLRRGTLSTTGISTNFVVAIQLPSTKHSDHWVLNGTAIICNLDD